MKALSSFEFVRGPVVRNVPAEMASLGRLLFDRPAERITAGRTFFAQGGTGDSIFQLVEGVVRHCRMLRDGRRMIAGFALHDELFDLARTDSYLFSAEAVTVCRLRRISAARLEILKVSAPHFHLRIIEELRYRQYRMNVRLLSMLHQSADERVANFLLDVGLRLCAPLRDGSRFDLAIPRGDIADHLGLSVETVCRAITRLRRDGIVALDGPCRVLVRDLAALRRRAAEDGDADEEFGEEFHGTAMGFRSTGSVQEAHP